MASRVGKTFEKDMLASVRSWGWWAERFTDRMWSQGGGSVQSPPDMICVRSDYWASYEPLGKMPVLMELKAVKSNDLDKASIPLKRCEGHQLERLLAFPGEAYVGVMFYEGDNAQKRSAVLIPVQAWVGAEDRYERLSLPLRALREDLSPQYHLRWVGRKAEVGPWVRCTQLGATPKEDR